MIHRAVPTDPKLYIVCKYGLCVHCGRRLKNLVVDRAAEFYHPSGKKRCKVDGRILSFGRHVTFYLPKKNVEAIERLLARLG